MARCVLDSALKRHLDRIQRVNGCRPLTEWKIPRSQFILWSKQIAELFTGESCFTYYTPFKYVNKEKIGATGKLLKHHEYLKGQLRKAGTLAPANSINDTEDEEVPVEATESCTWLATNIEPPADVRLNWQIAFPARVEFCVINKSTTAYYNAFPCLATHLAPELLREDFLILFPDARNFLENWKQALPVWL